MKRALSELTPIDYFAAVVFVAVLIAVKLFL